MRNVGLGIIGLGHMGQVHLRQSMKLNGAHLVGVADVSKRALASARNLGAGKLFPSYEQLLSDPDVDAVVISLPTHLHFQCAKKAAETGKHVFLEKPMARNVAEAGEILSTVRRCRVKLMIGYPLRFDSTFRSLKKEIDSGTLGDIEVAAAVNIGSGPLYHRAQEYAPSPVPEWWFNKVLTGGGALVDLGSHMINLLRWYFGDVTSIGAKLGHRFNMDIEDSATCIATFKSGTLATISVGWFSEEYRLRVDLFGTVSHASVQNPKSNALLTAAQMLATGTTRFQQPYRVELQHFVDCLLKDRDPSPSGEDGLKDLEAISKAYKNDIGLGNE